MNTLPGTKPMRYNLTKSLIIPHMKLDADFKDNRLSQLTHCALHFAARALGYKIKDQKVDDRLEWFTPELLRAHGCQENSCHSMYEDLLEQFQLEFSQM